MKIFVSSVMRDFEAEREAAFKAIQMLGHEIIRAEDFDPSSTSPRNACLEGVRKSDLVILVLGERYGYPQASGLSATHEEFNEAADTKEMIVFVQNTATREAEQSAFLGAVEDWQDGVFTRHFDQPSDLTAEIVGVLHRRGMEEARGRPDDDALKSLAVSLISESAGNRSYYQTPSLKVAVTVGPRQTILRPSQIDDKELKDFLFSKLFVGDLALFDRSAGSTIDLEGANLVSRQKDRTVLLTPHGDILITRPVRASGHMMAIIDEDVEGGIVHAFSLASEILAKIDETERIRYVSFAVTIADADNYGWRTEDEQRRNPNSMTMSMSSSEKGPVFLEPASRPRAVLRNQRASMAGDLKALLSRQFK